MSRGKAAADSKCAPRFRTCSLCEFGPRRFSRDTLRGYQAFAETLARWNGENEADRRELLALFERLTAAPQCHLFERFVAALLLQAACSEAVGSQC